MSMKISVESLSKVGAFSGAAVPKEIEWEQDGETYTGTVYVRRLSYQTAVADIFNTVTHGDGVAGRIAACICDEDGQPIFTAADITGEADPERGPLNHALTMALLKVIGEVNSPGKTKNSAKKK